MITNSSFGLQLPWSNSNEDEKFKKILTTLLIAYVVIAIPVVVIKLPELTRAEKEELPPQLARIMLEKQELPPPKPIEPPKPEEVKVDEKKIEEKKPEEKKPVEKIVKPIEKTTVTISPKPIKDASQVKSEAVAHAREKASNSGLMQFKDDLMEMRESLQASAVETAATNAPVHEGAATSAQVDRSMITSGVTKGSGGINSAAYSRDAGGTALSGRETTKVKSGLADASKKAAGATAGGGNSDGAGGAARSEEEVRKIMEQHKGAIFNIYNKALRDDATLQGKVVVKMVIDPDGRVVDATIVSSELKSPELETKLLQRIKLITFSASNVMRTTLNYSFDFLPQ